MSKHTPGPFDAMVRDLVASEAMRMETQGDAMTFALKVLDRAKAPEMYKLFKRLESHAATARKTQDFFDGYSVLQCDTRALLEVIDS